MFFFRSFRGPGSGFATTKCTNEEREDARPRIRQIGRTFWLDIRYALADVRGDISKGQDLFTFRISAVAAEVAAGGVFELAAAFRTLADKV